MAHKDPTELDGLLRKLAAACKDRKAEDLVSVACEVAGAACACLMLKDDLGHVRVVSRGAFSPTPEILDQIRKLSAQVESEDRPLLMPEQAASPGQPATQLAAGVTSCVLFPVKASHITGVLAFLGVQSHPLNARSSLLEPLVELTGCMLDSMHVQSTEEKASRLALVLRRTATVLRRSETVTEILSSATREATEEVSAAAGVAFYWDEDSKAFQLASVWARNKKQARFLGSLSWEQTPALKRVIEIRGPVTVDSTDRDMLPEGMSEALGDGAMLATPIIFEDRFLGAMLVGPIDRESLGGIQVEILKGVARQLGAGVQNIRVEDGIKKLESKLQSELIRSQLLSMVSHELRTPLTSIKGYATTLLRYYDKLPDNERVEFIQYIGEASDRLNALLDDLLDTSKLEAGLIAMEKTRVNLGELVLQAVSEFQRRGSGYHFVEEIAPDLPQVEADGRRIHQVLSNLLGNAVKYSPEGDTISVGCKKLADCLQVNVSDHGPGIPPEHLPRIFEPFYQVDQSSSRRKGGVGLGLAICQRLVQAHNGRIWAESEPGKGSTFFFTLPLPQAEAQSKP